MGFEEVCGSGTEKSAPGKLEITLAMAADCGRVTLVLFRTRRRDECSRLKESVRRRVRKSRQKEAAGAVDAGPMQIEWSEA